MIQFGLDRLIEQIEQRFGRPHATAALLAVYVAIIAGVVIAVLTALTLAAETARGLIGDDLQWRDITGLAALLALIFFLGRFLLTGALAVSFWLLVRKHGGISGITARMNEIQERQTALDADMQEQDRRIEKVLEAANLLGIREQFEALTEESIDERQGDDGVRT